MGNSIVQVQASGQPARQVPLLALEGRDSTLDSVDSSRPNVL